MKETLLGIYLLAFFFVTTALIVSGYPWWSVLVCIVGGELFHYLAAPPKRPKDPHRSRR